MEPYVEFWRYEWNVNKQLLIDRRVGDEIYDWGSGTADG